MSELIPENIEAEPKLEWGPQLREMSWGYAQDKIMQLNSKLAEGEKQWRLPTADELKAKFKKTGSTPAGFYSDYYWSSTTSPVDSSIAYYVNMGDGRVYHDKDYSDLFVCCVRDAV
jgi:hypothetical protein